MGTIDVLMQWVHLFGAATAVGGSIFAAWAAADAAALPGMAARIRPLAFLGVGALLLSGLWNLAMNLPGKPVQYHMALGLKLLLALHVFAMLILAGAGGAERDARRPALLKSAAVSGVAVLLLSAYLRRGF